MSGRLSTDERAALWNQFPEAITVGLLDILVGCERFDGYYEIDPVVDQILTLFRSNPESPA